MNVSISRLLFWIGCKIRNPSYFHAYNELQNSDFFTLSELQSIQQRRLNDLLTFAYKNSAYYYSKLSNIFSGDVRIDIDTLKRVPVVTKDDLIKHNSEIHTIKNHKFKKLFFSETSGSDGRALTFYKDERWDSYNRASIARGLGWYGVFPWDRNGYLWGYSLKMSMVIKNTVLDSLVNRFRLFSYEIEASKKFLCRLKSADYLSGYSSMIYELARISNANNIQVNLKLVKGTSEKIYDHYHVEALKAFGTKIISEYGAAEAGIIAFECPYGGLHINEETCIVEVSDGQIYVTNLLSFSFPIIRYKLGDYVELSEELCKCGRHRRLISDVLGRVGKSIVGVGNRKFPSLTLYYIFKRLALEHGIPLNYRAEQHVPGALVLFLEEVLNKEQEQTLLGICNDYFDGAVSIGLKQGVEIHDKSKKLKDFYSTLLDI